jgi:lysophospholipase L1-like esterase
MIRRLCLFLPLATALVASPCPAQDATTAPLSLELPDSNEGLAGDGPIRRYDWFRNLWRNRRAKFARQSQHDQGAVVFLGDSITQGWGDDFQGDFSEIKTANRGISGDTTRGMLLRLKEDVLKLNPTAVVMLMGTNDLEENAEPETIAGNVQLIIAELKKHNEQMPIVLCQVFPSSAIKKRPAAKIKELNRLCAAAVRGDQQVTVVDTWTLFANAAGDAKQEEFPDLLHPNRAGYVKWKHALWPILATLGLVEKQPDDFQVEAGFESLFNGKDLTGWGYRPTPDSMRKAAARWKERDPNAPAWPLVETAVNFDGESSSPDGRFVAQAGRLVVTTPAEGRKIQQLWTQRNFSGNFKLILEFRATPNADSGIFIRQPQLQCRDYALAGPYKTLKNYQPGQWNEIVVTVENGIADCTCNGEVLETALAVPATGPIGLEGDRGQVEYRRIRLRPLP